MTFRQYATTFGALTIALTVIGCASAPDTELADAQTAIDQAQQTAQADQWAPDEFAEARAALDEARREIETQSNRFAMMRDYDKARQDLARATTAAQQAQQAASAQKENARQEANIRLQEATAAIDLAREAIGNAPVTKDTRVDIQLFNQDLEGLDQSLTDVQGLITSEDYRGATVKAEAITAKANEIADQLTAARERVDQRRR